jgi:opacity protein-like surface antigen
MGDFPMEIGRMIGLSRSTFALVLLGCLLALGSARAQTFDSGPYLGASAGLILFQDIDADVGPIETSAEFAPGYDVALQLGYRFSVLRAELEVEYGVATLDDVEAGGISVDPDLDFSMLRGTAGLYLDLTLLPLFTPYVGGGVGAAHIDGDTTVVNGVTIEIEDDTHLTAHGEVGLALDFLPYVSIVPAYRFIWIDSGDGEIDDTTAHLLKLGVRLEF